MKPRFVAYLAAIALLVSLIAVSAASPATAASGVTRQIALAGTGSPITGAFVQSPDGRISPSEFESPEGPDLPSFDGVITPSTTRGTGTGGAATSNPQLKAGFEGLNLFQQRWARGGNQFTLEPPDQGLCVGNGYILETVNDVMNVYNSSGVSLLAPNDVGGAVDLNSFFGYQPEVDRSTGVFGPSPTDPSCIYDSQTNTWFLVALILERDPSGPLTLENHLDIAVSKTGNPTGKWNLYHVDVTNDGSSPKWPCPCIGDYPHIGADANGFYVTTNAYPWTAVASEFAGAQIYAFSKRKLAAGASSVSVTRISTWASVDVMTQETPSIKQPGFTVWPSVSASVSTEVGRNGTEFFMSSNAADEATHPIAGIGGNYTSDKIVVWSLTNTRSLDSSTPSLDLTNKVLKVNMYAIPARADQPGSGRKPGDNTPQGKCINDTKTKTVFGKGCWNILFLDEPAHNEVISRLDSNDTRMQQVMYANGKLWSSLGTAVTVGGKNLAGIAYFVVNVGAGHDGGGDDSASGLANDRNSTATPSIALQGTYGVAGKNLIYPAVGVTSAGKGVVAFTLTGANDYPSAGYASLDAANGIGAIHIAAAGATTDDGFTSYKAQVGNPPRTRWGDYGAAAVDGNSIWIASEYIAHECDYDTWGGDAFVGGTGRFGVCGGTRAALGNWSTRVSKVTP